MNTDKNAAMRPSVAAKAAAYDKFMDAFDRKTKESPLPDDVLAFNACAVLLDHYARELDAAQPAQAGEAVAWRWVYTDTNEPLGKWSTEGFPELSLIEKARTHSVNPARIEYAYAPPSPQPEQPASAVEWTTDQPKVPGVYRVRGFSIDDASRTGVVEVLHGDGALICNIHRENTDPDHTTWYSVADLNPRFEWQRLVAQSPAVSPPSVVAVSDETVRDALESAQALIGVMFGRSDGSIPATVDTPLSVPVKVRDIARDIDKALESFASRIGSGERDALLDAETALSRVMCDMAEEYATPTAQPSGSEGSVVDSAYLYSLLLSIGTFAEGLDGVSFEGRPIRDCIADAIGELAAAPQPTTKKG